MYVCMSVKNVCMYVCTYVYTVTIIRLILFV